MKFLSILLIAMITLSACASPGNIPNVGEQKEHGFDMIETTAEAAELPRFLEHTHEDIESVYEEVVQHEELLTHIPCYCGCGDSANHRDVYECFVHQVSEDGSVTWDDHGMKCGVCLEIAHTAVQMKNDGIDKADIRTAIDAHYGEDYPEPTPTPEISSE
ncbi:uncharacterized protein with PCYCGC motif [Salsuginibacillus halophilus]|uniref:Uncharacterized protein with PCYCGC motif n=1 Tax=Salsuginibacillus halophilus TaxID=517424 RepID=A0A2P8HG17_9BACI|nr:PCYCGC motif-containing (lipo)protein [Salsuginibacillus halophilus]PSL45153.1 uncharacterized protein with PCYCGC motif [Salsuginibacillus halophilus]